MFIGFYCALKSDYSYSSVLVLGVSLAFLIYTVINLPFNDAYQNYRSFLIHFTTTYILLTTNFYQIMKSSTPLEVKAFIISPAVIELVLLGCCIVASMACLAYELYLAVKVCKYKRDMKIRNLSLSKVSMTEQSAFINT
jgi:hypothetical protein